MNEYLLLESLLCEAKRPSIALRLGLEVIPKNLKPKVVDGPPVEIRFPDGLKLADMAKVVKALKAGGWILESHVKKGPKNRQVFWRFKITHQKKERTALLAWDGFVSRKSGMTTSSRFAAS